MGDLGNLHEIALPSLITNEPESSNYNYSKSSQHNTNWNPLKSAIDNFSNRYVGAVQSTVLKCFLP